MIIIPAIDLMGGKVVRLAQGDLKRPTVYAESPVDMARQWEACGARLIHVVDLDGAVSGTLQNLAVVEEMVRAVKVKIELGGGIRDAATIRRVLALGVEKVVVGTRALEPGFFDQIAPSTRHQIVAGIDAKDGMVYAKGWIVKTTVTAEDAARLIAASGIKRINYTDITKDGMLAGPNLTSLRTIAEAVTAEIVASGGVSSLDDIRAIKALGRQNIVGAIVGKALYEKRLDLREAIAAAGQ